MKIIAKLFKNLVKMSEKSSPVVVIIGATGCSKTKLSLEIAKRFNGEIISADSMQVYKGLDIITNKATNEERQLIPHHLIDFLGPLSRFTVTDFSHKALKTIDDLMARGKLPIIVGGTNYYIESILWKVLIVDEYNKSSDILCYDRESYEVTDIAVTDDELTKDYIFSIPIYSDSFKTISNNRLHQVLSEIDPITAQELHPNNRRKVIRSLQIYQQNKRPKSELIEEQKSLMGGSQLGGPLRFTNSVILWVDCQRNVLINRLDERVDQMIERGLIDELLAFHCNYNKARVNENLNADYTKGIFQSIGFKEFHNYLLLTEEQRKHPLSRNLFEHGVESLKSVTKSYAKQQIKWIRNRFLRLSSRQVPDIYRLDTTFTDQWTQQVLEPAMAVVESLVNGTPLPSHIRAEPKLELNENHSRMFRCDICQKYIPGSTAYQEHLKSKGHKYKLGQENNTRKQRLHQLFAILKRHENRLKTSRRNSI